MYIDIFLLDLKFPDLRAVPRNIGPIQDQEIIASGYSYFIDLFNKGISNKECEA